jgi:phospholipid-binding lipoprotein MlaA
MPTQPLRNATLVLAMAALTGCATVQTPTKEDPLEGFNRTMFTFNDKVDQYALKPIAKGYVFVTPQPVRDSVTNFFSNIGDVYIAANNLLQLKIADGVSDIFRIVINTIFGVGGLFDVATLAKLPKHDNDLGLTLGHYGVREGPYLVLPLFGPSTVRDAVGYIGNYYVNPLTYVRPDSVSWALYGLNVVSTRANLLSASDVLEGAALDKYSFVRNAYLQRRKYLLSGGSSGSLPDYGETPPPNYEGAENGAEAPAAASAPAPGAAAPSAAAPNGASAPAVPSAAVPAPGSTAIGASPASGTEVTPPVDANGMPSTTTVPAGQLVPPARFGYPSLRLLPR